MNAVFELINFFILEVSFHATPHFVPEFIRITMEYVSIYLNLSEIRKMKSTKALKLLALPFSTYFVKTFPIGQSDEKALVAVLMRLC